nr:hypothetical protein [Microcystis aeruginosa]
MRVSRHLFTLTLRAQTNPAPLLVWGHHFNACHRDNIIGQILCHHGNELIYIILISFYPEFREFLSGFLIDVDSSIWRNQYHGHVTGVFRDGKDKLLTVGLETFVPVVYVFF